MILPLKKMPQHFPISYSTLFRLSRNPDSPFLPSFLVVGGKRFVDLERFTEIAEKQNEKKALERKGV